ncbi:MAG: molybdopterin converting factor subunit 1 [Sorangiineae bacterium]|nr:molybdopterin converting factor subunit 1 [Polyangiaceae bacterium]MEB2322048.1 molybdopterin converting factor subunit 1 [Sorangiineae bacterium]
MSIEVLYFAGVRDTLGQSGEHVDLPEGVATVAAFARHLEHLHPKLGGRLGSVRFAVNEVFARDDDPVVDGDVVALIPPVAGG